MRRRSIIIRCVGLLLGLTAAAVVLGTQQSREPAAAPGQMLSECDGALRDIVIQYVAGADAVVPVYRDFLRQLPGDVVVRVMCPDRAAFDEFTSRVELPASRFMPILTGHAMTAWSRDRWIALAPASDGAPTTLVAPHGELGADAWPARAGDERLAADLVAADPDHLRDVRSPLEFDGGDLLADESTVFVTPAVLRRNLHRVVDSAADLEKVLHRALGRRIVLLDRSPEHHAGMFMMAAGRRTMLVGDPSLGRRYQHGDTENTGTLTDSPSARCSPCLRVESFPELPGGPDFSPETQANFDAVAAQLAAAGYRVVRIPTVPAADGKSYLTYVNVITDHRDGRDVVYMPTYRGAAAMNVAAADVWRGLGYDVRPVDCTSTYRCFGNVHCLVNVLRRT